MNSHLSTCRGIDVFHLPNVYRHFDIGEVDRKTHGLIRENVS
jgi:hypothetical protein